MSEALFELIKETISKIENYETRARARNPKAQLNFEHAVKVIIFDLWRSEHSTPKRECSINKRSGFYSETPRYRDPLLTFKQTMAAFNGLQLLNYIEITKDGYFDRETLQGAVTKFIARDELRERLLEIDEHPALSITQDITVECIILRDTVDGQRAEIDYTDTPKTDEYRANLQLINKCFLKHWPDIELKDTDYLKLGEAISSDDQKLPIDFSRRTLVRIFSNGSFKKGGRFYRGWWQNVPSNYRKHITIDAKKTCEYDFSQLNPHMIYFAHNYEIGTEDAYDRVLDGQHRDLVKSAFNAMIQADSSLRTCPRGIEPSVADMSWGELRDRIIEAHKPISHLFFTGLGNSLQFEDSCIAESVMLQFAAIDAPALPIHDSFIMHHGYGGELEEAMRRAFHGRFRSDIPVSSEIINWIEPDDTPPTEISVDYILKKREEYGQWSKRNDDFLNNKYDV